MGIRVLVCGGRAYGDGPYLFATLDRIDRERGIDVVMTGGATGADTLALQWAKQRGLDRSCIKTYRANWNDISHTDANIMYRRDGTAYDAAAGPRRNAKMLADGKPNLVVAFPGDHGTAGMVRLAREAKIEVVEVT